MVGETVTPDWNTHFWFNGIPGNLKEIRVSCKYNIIEQQFTRLTGMCRKGLSNVKI
jgi:hypothetical protein